MKMEQSVPKRRHIKFRRRGITQKKTYNNVYCALLHILRQDYCVCETWLTFKNRASYIYMTGVPLPSRCCILYTFSTNISTEYFKHAVHSPFFSSRSHSDTPNLVGILWTGDQPDTETSTWQHNSHKRHVHGPGRIGARNSSKLAGADPRLRLQLLWSQNRHNTTVWTDSI